MKSRVEALCLIVMLAASVGCANNAGGTKDAAATTARNAAVNGEGSAYERQYRNPFLRSRHIGEAACAE